MSRFGRNRRIHPTNCSCHVCQDKITHRHYNLVRATVAGIVIMAICI